MDQCLDLVILCCELLSHEHARNTALRRRLGLYDSRQQSAMVRQVSISLAFWRNTSPAKKDGHGSTGQQLTTPTGIKTSLARPSILLTRKIAVPYADSPTSPGTMFPAPATKPMASARWIVPSPSADLSPEDVSKSRRSWTPCGISQCQRRTSQQQQR